MNGSEGLRRTYRETAIASGAMVASVLAYAVVVEVLRSRLPPGGVGAGVDADLLRYGFYLLAAVAGLPIPLLRRTAEAAPGSRERAGPPAGGCPGDGIGRGGADRPASCSSCSRGVARTSTLSPAGRSSST